MTNRTAQVHAACDKIAAQAVADGRANCRIVVSMIRERGIRGSQNDIQQDIHSWYLNAYRNHLDAGRIDGVPPALVAIFQQLYQTAMDEATATLEADRQALEAEKVGFIEATQEAIDARKQAEQTLQTTQHELQLANTKLAHQEQQIAEQRLTLHAQAERIEALESEERLARERHAAELQSLHQSTETRIAQIRDDAQRQADEFEGLRTHLMRQTDEIRTALRDSNEVNSALKTKIETAITMESALRERAARAERQESEARGQVAALQTALNEATESRDALVEAGTLARHERAKLRKATRIIRKLWTQHHRPRAAAGTNHPAHP